MCGPSGAESSTLGAMQGFYSALQGAYGVEFQGQQNILNTLNAAYQPILAGGPSQQGMSAAEQAAETTQAINTTAGNYGAAARAAGSAMAARGGGNMFLPSGVNEAVQGGIAAQAAGQLSAEELGITQKSYDIGRQNFWEAGGALGGNAQLYNPAAMANVANTSGSNAFNAASTIWQQGNEWVGALGGAVGAAAQGFLGGPAFAKMV